MNNAVVVLFHHSDKLKWYEEISLQQTCRVLQQHPIRLVCPRGIDRAVFQKLAPQIEFDEVPAKWMSSLRRYNRMKILPDLYRRFADYEFMLTCELDCFVFRDELEQWCERGFDYIGAPWIQSVGDNGQLEFGPGGNSGFSLRNIQSALRVMRSFHMVENPVQAAIHSYRKRKSALRAIRDFVELSIGGNSHAAINFYHKNEDRFWSALGQKLDWFRLASAQQAIAFSFECEPTALYRLNGDKLPFGCHAWQKYELAFWRPHIENYGFKLPEFDC